MGLSTFSIYSETSFENNKKQHIRVYDCEDLIPNIWRDSRLSVEQKYGYGHVSDFFVFVYSVFIQCWTPTILFDFSVPPCEHFQNNACETGDFRRTKSLHAQVMHADYLPSTIVICSFKQCLSHSQAIWISLQNLQKSKASEIFCWVQTFLVATWHFLMIPTHFLDEFNTFADAFTGNFLMHLQIITFFLSTGNFRLTFWPNLWLN